ncbi:MAG: fibrobacter succinogenes major paralogous domain-containing protein, partial [Prevotellaceae bacterium]|jgi:uncharacterized protein (TIGR02145 family)|nr:fibrobacter succinogenes major paralogous domain-containing protein [Prevotellaceae bacterium]
MGWHVPTDREWATLLDNVEGNTTFTNSQTSAGWWGTDAGMKLKSSGTFTGTDPGDGSWLDHAKRGADASGFGAAPAGGRYDGGVQFFNRGIEALYWSSAVWSASIAWYRNFSYRFAGVERHRSRRSAGFSVRCVRD